MRLTEFYMILASLALGSFGQVAIKYGINQFGQVRSFLRLFQAFGSPWILLGLFLYVLGTLFWVTVLSRVRLSLAYPMISLSYVLVTFLAWWFFHDHITPLRIAGILLICIGVACVGRS
jgi:drug/metabolite transporter (DMT)-like permease